jgi:hypothetical protein
MSSLLLRTVLTKNLVNIKRYQRRRADPGRRRYCGRQRILLHAARVREQVSKDDFPFAVSLLQKKLACRFFGSKDHRKKFLIAVFRIRNPDPDPGARRAKMTHKSRESKEMSCFEVLDVLSFESWRLLLELGRPWTSDPRFSVYEISVVIFTKSFIFRRKFFYSPLSV